MAALLWPTALMAKPVEVFVAVTAAVLVPLVKDAGPWASEARIPPIR
jgi:hypothetical protein